MPQGVRRIRRAVLVAADVASSGLALAVRAGALVGAPLLRLGRLASLRARVDGRVPITTQFDGSVETAGRVRLELGEHCRLGRRVFLETCGKGAIRIADHVRINSGTFLVAYEGITIGRDTLVGEYVSIRDADHGLAADRPIREQPHAAREIRIGEGVWIGRGSVILKGISIGRGAVVAANSVVTHDVPPMTIVAGVPAREIRVRPQAVPAVADEAR